MLKAGRSKSERQGKGHNQRPGRSNGTNESKSKQKSKGHNQSGSVCCVGKRGSKCWIRKVRIVAMTSQADVSSAENVIVHPWCLPRKAAWFSWCSVFVCEITSTYSGAVINEYFDATKASEESRFTTEQNLENLRALSRISIERPAETPAIADITVTGNKIWSEFDSDAIEQPVRVDILNPNAIDL